jgi:RNA polymerase sigma factor (TIGR02999 family)
MESIVSGEITSLLKRVQEGDEEAKSLLVSAAYAELRKIASRRLRGERPGHTLQTTDLVHEAYLKLVNQRQASWQNRAQFYGVAAEIMRRILVDHARARLSQKRGAGVRPLPLDEALVFSVERSAELLDLDEALQRLEIEDPRASRVVELRFFAGLSVKESAAVMKISTTTVRRDWKYGRAWLKAELGGDAKSAGQAAGAG